MQALLNALRTNQMNNMTDEEAKGFNLACVEFMGYESFDILILPGGICDAKTLLRAKIPNYATDSNDLDLVIEKMKLDIVFERSSGYWKCKEWLNLIVENDKDRRTAIIKCIQQVLRGKV